MKIFSFIVQSSAAKFIIIDITDAMQRLGHETNFFDFDTFFVKHQNLNDKDKYTKLGEIILQIRNFQPDIIFGYGLEYFSQMFTSFICDLQASLYDLLKMPCLNLLFDFGEPFHPYKKPETEDDIKIFKDLQNSDNLFFCWDKVAVDIMKKCGVLKTHFFPMAVNERNFYKFEPDNKLIEQYGSDIIFIGGPTPERIAALETLAGLNLKIFGYDSEKWLANEKLKKCYSGQLNKQNIIRGAYNVSKISINVTREHGFASLNMRVYEAMACGNLMLTDDKSDARELFAENEEIIIFRDYNDLKNKTEYFLAHKDQLNNIANAGRNRVLKEHTYLKRFENYLPIIVKFLRENIALKKISDIIISEPKKAEAYLKSDFLKNEISYNKDNMYFLFAQLYHNSGDTKKRDIYRKKVFEINPLHYNSLELI